MRSWMTAWSEAATGPAGFWRRSGVGPHFRTASATGTLLATAIREVLSGLSWIRAVVEIGAGDGLLVQALHEQEPSLRLTAVDLRPRPPGVSPAIRWITDSYAADTGRWRGAAEAMVAEPALVVCAEWLDDLPCPVVSRRDDRWYELLVDDRGDEQFGPPVGAEDDAWLRRWWPVPDPQEGLPAPRAEVGRTRDCAWAGLMAALAPYGGAGLMIDYGHRYADRPVGGTLTGYRDGRRLPPRPTPTMNLTAHVAVDAVAEAGERAGARTRFLLDQRTAITRLAPPPPSAPTHDLLGVLQRRSERAALTAAWGEHRWLLQTVPAPDR